tara:strand:+ start:268 stop:1059 length:792 start_codon:yes stop_codon:yes gene_type:complete
VSIFTIISPAKRLGKISRTDKMPSEATLPVFEDEARQLASLLSRKSVTQLMELMSISKDLAELNRERYNTFPGSLKKSQATAAILQFQGDVYQGLELNSYGARENKYLRDHLSILSGMYGLLRPFDLMHPYRLEMGSRLKVSTNSNLYRFWGNRITDALKKRIQESGAKVLMNLASDEYFRAVNLKEIVVPVATADFLELRKGKWKVISTNAKRARGTMLNWIIQNRPGTISALKKFDVGYEFAEEVADAHGIHRMVFHRKET